MPAMQERIDRALRLLGIRNFLLGIHEAAFPGTAEEDLGRGSPYSAGAAGFIAFARNLGFTGIQLGPQGITTSGNPSPYDGTWFSRNPLSLAPLPLTRPDYQLLAPQELAALVARLSPDRSRVDEQLARRAIERLSQLLCLRLRRIVEEDADSFRPLTDAYAAFQQQHADWLHRDALYDILKTAHGDRLWQAWGLREDQELLAQPARLAAFSRLHRTALDDFSFIQFLLATQHLELRTFCRGLGLKLFGDCQIGMSDRDAWQARDLLLPGYVLGAPPSRTHPGGQPWNYPLLDPEKYWSTAGSRQEPGPAVRFFRTRMEKFVQEFDGLRLDHPHGLICPWVYRQGQADPFAAVRHGARLFASPNLADHPQLARHAIVRADQLNERAARYDDHWVTTLEPDQVERYAGLFAEVMAAAGRAEGGCEIACEILSTEPNPVKRVRELYGLGRFRVTQKADLSRDDDVYRSENCRPEDWLMLSTHDTEPIWPVAERWRREGQSLAQAEYLAARLAIPQGERGQWIAQRAANPGSLVQAKFADLFVGAAQNVLVYFTDLLGFRESYNRPGTVSPDNWTLRVHADYRRRYGEKLAAGLALDIPKALAMALRARFGSHNPLHADLIRELEDGFKT